MSIEKTMNLFIKNNKNYELIDRIQETLKKEKIIYELFLIKDTFNEETNFIYISDSAAQRKTYNYLISQKKLPLKAKIIILISNKSKKGNLKKLFNTDNVFYIEEFGSKHLYHKCFDEDLFHTNSFHIKYFIDPFVINSKEKTALAILHDWITEPANPLIVIKGCGGIGKTTLIKYFLDELIKSKNNSEDKMQSSNILFINSNEILNNIVRYSKIDDVFQFYKALSEKRNIKNSFDKELLELSVDNGNLLIVLDGIDEVIAKAGDKFNINAFITSIYENYSVGLEKTKIIITCRDFFWNDINITNQNIKTIELKAFDQTLSEKFLLKKFPEKGNKYTKAKKLANEFATSSSSSNNSEYIPYILDLITDIVERDKDFGTNKEDLNSSILNTKINNDYLIGRVCAREIIKLENKSIDNQIDLLMKVAVEYDGAIPLKSLRSVLIKYKLEKNLITKFKAHPILSTSDELLLFRYDFFTEYFKNLFISKFLSTQTFENLTSITIKILNDYVKYENDFSKNIINRVDFNEDLKIFIIDIFQKMDEDKISDLSDEDKRKFKSSILTLFLMDLKLSSEQQYNLENRTKLLKDLFEDKDNNLNSISIINILKGKSNPTFDFSNTIIINSWFENYYYFWSSKFNDKTRFKKCIFKDLNLASKKSPKLYPKMFDESCDVTDIQAIINNHNRAKEEKENNVRDDLKKIIKYFEQGGKFKPRKHPDVRSRFNTIIIDKLVKNKILASFKDPKKVTLGVQYKITQEYSELIKVLEQGGTYYQFEEVVKLITDK